MNDTIIQNQNINAEEPKKAKTRYAFIGPMGCGKSTIVNELARLTGDNVIDTDEVFIKNYGDIDAFFKTHEESEFRKIENEILQKTAKSNARFVATGGGSVLNEDGMNRLKERYTIVYIDTPIAELKERIRYSNNRPLKNELEKLIAVRLPLYLKYADIVIKSIDDMLKLI